MNNFFNSIFFFLCLSIFAQELPPVVNFTPNDYAAGNQNWMVSQSLDDHFYFANNSGLLEFTGEKWNLYPVPNKTVVRSVLSFKDRIYTGAYMEFGYWTKNEFKELEYHSLNDKFPNLMVDGEQFWNIESYEGLIIFRSFEGVYFYDPEPNSIILMENSRGKPISALYKLEDGIYFQYVGEGLFNIKNGKPQLLIPQEKLGKDQAVIEIFKRNGKLAYVSQNAQFYEWDENNLVPFFTETTSEFNNQQILSADYLKNGNILLGTVGKGIFEINSEGKMLHHFNQENDLLNNTALALYEDKTGNVWAGLDFGISLLDLNSPVTGFEDNRGEIGSVYSFLAEGEALYLGTNQGLYYRDNGGSKFDLISGTNGQVWDIRKENGVIFCGHNSGTFQIDGNKATKISDRLGTWLVKAVNEKTFIQGHYNGISFLKKKDNNTIVDTPMIEGFPHSSKFIEIDDKGDIWIGNEHKGVFRIKLNDSLQVSSIINYPLKEESGVNSSIFQFNDTLYYSTQEHIYQFNERREVFSKKNSLEELFKNKSRLSGRVVSDTNAEKIWAFGNEGIYEVSRASLNNSYELKVIYIDQKFRNIAVGYENLSKINENEYLVGISNGYLKFDNATSFKQTPSVHINSIVAGDINSEKFQVKPDESGEFGFKNNNIDFEFSTPNYSKYLEAQYSYRLLGLTAKWSRWDTGSMASFENLPFGEYTFEVRSKVGNEQSEISTYEFEIKRPFYLSYIAIFLYVFIIIAIILLVNVLYNRHHRKIVLENERALKLKNLQAEQEIIKLKNEKLEQEMDSKNRELAVSTMSMIKKNEFLTHIKDELKDKADSSKIRSVIKTIDKDINEKDNWEFFKKAFSNADKDFFKKVKNLHPELTSSDLKLCAYLRLNLSSKEIAPLLNISTKSVEIKRYRLRKKMDLDRNVNLTEYILNL
ncbi:triple tyrosine motif-containing protein [Gramella sp. AN32]|uniref:Triple tyrosine motif-containing protein n=1 Tax=Christiangramia antarctica TaxID=2058158 RepID=A0ABW5X988_9FLAO|nr:triple tyrosine motif-containing protein [Gramella sp. AN32]